MFLKDQILQLKKDKNAVLLAHFYQEGMIQDIADFVGDSLQLAQKAKEVDSKLVIMAGVYFMAETVKILCPDKKVLIPDSKAGCSLAESCDPKEFKKFIEKYPGYTVVTYVNTSAEIKAMSDITCTSSNAVKIVESLNTDKIIFAPDKNLGNYINSVTGKNMVVWDGACHVHERFSLEKMLSLKEKYKDAKILAHPECSKKILIVADHVGSTSSLLKYSIDDPATTYIVATESGILHQMKKSNPSKTFIAAPPDDSTCACNECMYMKLITLEKIKDSLIYEKEEVKLEKDIIEKARKPIEKMLELSAKMGIK